MVKSGLMGGKSIGFLTVKSHPPTDEEVKRNPALRDVWRIVDEWQLVEYSCCWLPVNPETVVEAVSKALLSEADLRAFGIDLPAPPAPRPPAAGDLASMAIPFTPLCEVEKAVHCAIERLDLHEVVRKAVAAAYDRARGRV